MATSEEILQKVENTLGIVPTFIRELAHGPFGFSLADIRQLEEELAKITEQMSK